MQQNDCLTDGYYCRGDVIRVNHWPPRICVFGPALVQRDLRDLLHLVRFRRVRLVLACHNRTA